MVGLFIDARLVVLLLGLVLFLFSMGWSGLA